MDGQRFDDLTRRMATGTSRRQVLRLGSGGLVAGLLALAGLGEAAADDTPKPIGKKCNKSAQCASGYCHPAIGTCAPPPILSTGEITTDNPTFFVNCYGISGTFYYDTVSYTHGGGPISIGLRGEVSGGGTLWNTVLWMYTSFDPSNPCANVVDVSMDYCMSDAYLNFSHLAAGTYTLVAHTYYPVHSGVGTGTYTLVYDIAPAC